MTQVLDMLSIVLLSMGMPSDKHVLLILHDYQNLHSIVQLLSNNYGCVFLFTLIARQEF